MAIPVIAIVRAAYRDAARFIARHPVPLAATLLCALPFDYWLAAEEFQRNPYLTVAPASSLRNFFFRLRPLRSAVR